jgi:hypothetical protein
MSQQMFIYGDFRYPASLERLVTRGVPPLRTLSTLARMGEPEIGIEVLREYGPSELRGKLYSWQIGGWKPIEPLVAQSQLWYVIFDKSPKNVVFDMQSTGTWEILFFRRESDANGAYMAVALRYLNELPAWLAAARKSPR